MKKIICFGDSNTYGYDPRSYFGGRYLPEYRWVDILARKTEWEVRNLGSNGREIPVGLQGVPEDSLVDAAQKMSYEFKKLTEEMGIYFADAEKRNVGLAYDGVHFTEKGHQAFAEGLIKYLKELWG